jgi:hypothetical protein
MQKKESKKLTIVISPEVYKKLNEGGFNGNKLVNQLLKKFLEKQEK